MAAGVGVPGGVAVRRIVAAQGCAALLAGPQVDPAGADPDAFLALVALRLPDFLDGSEMAADSFSHGLHLFAPNLARFSRQL